MGIAEVRKNLEEIRSSAQSGDLPEVLAKVEQALTDLDESRLLTTSEAAALLGIRSVNTLKLLVRRAGLPHVMHGNRMMIPASTLESIRGNRELKGIQSSDRAHNAMEQLGNERGLTESQFRTLEGARPGHLPWKARAQVEENCPMDEM